MPENAAILRHSNRLFRRMKRHVNVVNALPLAAVNNLLTHAKPCCAELVTGSPKGSFMGIRRSSMDGSADELLTPENFAEGASTMTKVEKEALSTMTPEQLIEGFVREAKLYQLSDVPRANAALDNQIAYEGEIKRRGGLSSLVQLMENADAFIAYSAAGALVTIPEFREAALAVLDRIADGRLGSASTRARIARNVIRYGSPDGDPVEFEKRLAVIRARENRA